MAWSTDKKSLEKASKVKKFLEDYGEKMGYDRTGFYQQMLKKFRLLEKDADFLKTRIGVQRSGGIWVGFKKKLKPWLDSTVRPGPNFGIQSVPEDWSPQQFLGEAEGIYHLKAVLKKLSPDIVTYWKVIGAVKRSQFPAEEIGVTLRNGVYVVDMANFRPWYLRHEPMGIT